MKVIALAFVAIVFATQDPDPHAWLVNEPLFWYGQLVHAFPILQGQDGPPECTAEKPWMCGSIEIGCSRIGIKPDDEQTAEFYKCSCRHTCNKDGSKDDETQGRNWDAKCKARCNPRHCHCPHPCGST